MGKFGFIFLIIGGALLLFAGQSISLDPGYAAQLISLINTFIGTALGIPNLGEMLVGIIWGATIWGGAGVILGAIIWFVAGHGVGALIGKIIVNLSTFALFFYVAMQIYNAYAANIFHEPLHIIIAHFSGLGLGFAAMVITLIGTYLGASRPRVPKNSA